MKIHMLTVRPSSNYPLWRDQVVGQFEGQNVLGFIDGPENDDVKPNRAAYVAWKQQDQRLLSVLKSSLSAEAMAKVLYCDSSRAVWLALESAFANGSNKRKRQKEEIPTAVAVAPPWMDLPAGIIGNILHRLGAVEILERAQLVCKTWCRVCEDPAMWRVIHLIPTGLDDERDDEICYEEDDLWRVAVDRSQGQLIQVSIDDIIQGDLLFYIVDRSNLLKRLTLQNCSALTGIDLVEAVQKLPHLEELHLIVMPTVQAADIMNIGISCPTLKSFTFSHDLWIQRPDPTSTPDDHAEAIAKGMPNLRHLSLICNKMKNKGLEAILDGCPRLESLDPRLCFHLDLQVASGIRFYEQIKHVRGPFDSISDIVWLKGRSDVIAFLAVQAIKEGMTIQN